MLVETTACQSWRVFETQCRSQFVFLLAGSAISVPAFFTPKF